MSIHSFTVYDMFKRNARLFKNYPALVFDNEIITFGELLKQIQSLSGSLSNQGIHKGDRVAILAQNSHSFFLLCGAAAAIGAIVVPINWRLSTDEIQYILLDSGPNAIFFDKNHGDLILELRPKCQSLKNFIVFGESEGDYVSFNKLMGDYPAEESEVKGNDPYIIMYTAAVQGQPKGAVLSQDNVIFCSIQAASMLGLTPRDTYLNILPMFHVSVVALAFPIMFVGGKNVIISSFDPRVVLRMIEKERVTVIGSFPPILTKLLAEMQKETCDLSSLKYVIGLDNPNTIMSFEKKTGSQFWLVYGQTETTGLTSLCPNSEKPGSSGKPGSLVNIKLIDEYGREVETGGEGEILVRGPLVFQGYWQQNELTRHTFRDGWHHTGDVGRHDEEGYLWYVGRKAEKELIKSGGENVYPVEIEKVILEHPGIKEVAVIGVPDPTFGEGIKAVCVLKANRKLSEEELIDFVAARIARYKKPRYLSFVDSLPKRENGSIDREKVKAMYGLGPQNL